MAYKIYVCDSLYSQSHNQMLNMRFTELLERPVDNRSGDEVALDVITAAGLRIKEV